MDVFLSILICFLSVYGIFKLLYNAVFYFYDVKKIKSVYNHHVIAVNDDCDNLEAYIRSAVMKEEEDVILIDYSENFDTKELLNHINSEFSIVTIMSHEEYVLYINNKIKHI